MVAGALVVSPAFGQPLRVPPADIVSVGESDGYGVRVVLRDGAVLDLAQLGRMRGQVLADLTEARGADDAGTSLLRGVGTPEVFPGAVDDVDGELWLYDDALVTMPGRGDPEKLPYPFIHGVSTDPSGYRLTLHVSGHGPVTVSRLARRTSEFVDLLRARVELAGGRTAAFLGALLPGLGAVALRQVAGLLRDGLAVPRRELDAVDPTVWSALVSAAAAPSRASCLATLSELGELEIGFKQVVSVHRDAVGVTTPWTDPSVRPTFQHDAGGGSFGGGSFGGGFGGMWAAGMVAGGPPVGYGFDGPFAAMGPLLALRMLGSGGAGGRQIQPRADVSRGMLTPESTDYAALTSTGDRPTVLAFVLCRSATGGVAFDVLNEPDRATYVYGAAEGLNRALDLVGFQVEAVHDDTAPAGSPYRTAAGRLPALRLLRDAYRGRVEHTDDWTDRLTERLRA